MSLRWTTVHRLALAATFVVVSLVGVFLYFDVEPTDPPAVHGVFAGFVAVWLALGVASLTAFHLESRGRWRWIALAFTPYVAAAAYDAAALLSRRKPPEPLDAEADVDTSGWRTTTVFGAVVAAPSLVVPVAAGYATGQLSTPAYAVSVTATVAAVFAVALLLSRVAFVEDADVDLLREPGVAPSVAGFAVLVFASTAVVVSAPDSVFDPAPFDSLLAYPVAFFSLPIYLLVQMESILEALDVAGPAAAAYLLYLSGVGLAAWTYVAPATLARTSRKHLMNPRRLGFLAAAGLLVAVAGLAAVSHSTAFLMYAEEPMAPEEPTVSGEPVDVALQQAEHDAFREAEETYEEFVYDHLHWTGFSVHCFVRDSRVYDEETWVDVGCQHSIEVVDEWGVQGAALPLVFERSYRVDGDSVTGYDVPVVGDTPVEAEADLSDAELAGVDLEEADLESANLSNASLKAVDLERANLTGADLTGADFEGVDLWNADLDDANLDDASFVETDVEQVSAVESSWRNASVESGSFRADMQRTRASDVVFRDVVFRRTYLSNSSMSNASFYSVEFTMDSELDGVDARGSVLRDVEFRASTLRNADFRGSDAEDVDYTSSSTVDCRCP